MRVQHLFQIRNMRVCFILQPTLVNSLMLIFQVGYAWENPSLRLVHSLNRTFRGSSVCRMSGLSFGWQTFELA